MHLPDISILGLGYLGLPLAQKFYEQGSQVAAIKTQSDLRRHQSAD